MRQASAKVWVAGTVVLAVLLLAATWLLAVQPVTASAAEDTAQAEQQRQQNDLLELEIVKLREQATHLEEYQAQLQSLRLQMPTTGDGASISRELQGLAAAAGVTILTVQPSVPEPFVAPAPAPDATQAPAADAPAEGTTDGTEPAAPSGVAGFYAVPITMSSVGSYDASVAFLRAVQSEASRLYLVSSITAVTQEAEGANAGRPATAAGDIELTMTGYAYVLIDSAAVPVDPATDDGTTLPTPTGQPNPFVPTH